MPENMARSTDVHPHPEQWAAKCCSAQGAVALAQFSHGYRGKGKCHSFPLQPTHFFMGSEPATVWPNPTSLNLRPCLMLLT